MIGNGYIYTEHGRSEEVKQKEARGGCNGATEIWEGGGPLFKYCQMLSKLFKLNLKIYLECLVCLE